MAIDDPGRRRVRCCGNAATRLSLCTPHGLAAAPAAWLCEQTRPAPLGHTRSQRQSMGV